MCLDKGKYMLTEKFRMMKTWVSNYSNEQMK